MKNLALVVSDLSNPEIRKTVYSLYPVLKEKYSVSVITSGEFSDPDFEGDVYKISPSDPEAGIFPRLFSEIKRILAIRKYAKQANLRILLSLTEETNFPVAFSFLPVKKAICCNSASGFTENQKIYSSMIKKADAVLLNSNAVRGIFESKFPALKGKLTVITSPADSSAATEGAKAAVPDEYKAFFEKKKVITALAPFTAKKGHWNILKSFEIVKETLKEAGLVFLGDGGELQAEIEEMAKNSKYADDILFIPENDNPYKYIAASSVFVQASSEETSARGLVEAMALKIPVVAADCGAFSTEILFEKYDPEYKCENMTFADYGILTPGFDSRVNTEYSVTYGEHIDFANGIKEMILSERIPQLLVDKAFASTARYSSDKALRKYVEFADKLYLCL